MYCPYCDRDHRVRIEKKTVHYKMRNIEYDYAEKRCFCEIQGQFFDNEQIKKDNTFARVNGYRRAAGLLDSGEIRQIRRKYRMTQRSLSLMLGWGEKTVTAYEGLQVQSRSHDMILRKLAADPAWFLSRVETVRDTVPRDEYDDMRRGGRIAYEKSADMYLCLGIGAAYAVYRNRPMRRGNTLLDLERTADAVRYIENALDLRDPNHWQVRTTLWYADICSYKQRVRAITGLVYEKTPDGPMPVAWLVIISLKPIAQAQEWDTDYPSLDQEDLAILDKAVCAVSDEKNAEIREARRSLWYHGQHDDYCFV